MCGRGEAKVSAQSALSVCVFAGSVAVGSAVAWLVLQMQSACCVSVCRYVCLSVAVSVPA